MAETVVLDIRLGDSFKRLAQVKQEINQLRQANKELDNQVKAGKLTTEQATQAQVVNEASIRELTKQQRRLRQSVDAQSRAQEGSIQANIVKLRQLKDAYEKLANPTKAQTKEIKDLSDRINEQKQAIGDNTSNIGNYSASVLDAANKSGFFTKELAILTKIQKSLSAVYQQSTNQIRQAAAAYSAQAAAAKANGEANVAMSLSQKAAAAATAITTIAMKALKVAIAATGIGLLIVAIASLTAALTASEEGQNKMNKILGVFGAIIGNVTDLLANLGEKIIAAFENPQQAVKDFANLIKDNIVNRFTGLIELIPQLGKAISLLFKGEFTEAGAVATNAVAKVSLGVEDLTGKIGAASDALKEFTQEQIKEAKLAADVADMRAKADILERQLTKDKALIESQIAELRLKSRQEDQFSAAERRKALLEAQKLQDSLLDQETEFLELRRDAQVLENTFSKTNKENKEKEAEAIAAVNRQVAARANNARMVQRELNRINNEIERDNKKAQDQQIKAAQEEEKRQSERLALLTKIRDEVNQTFVSEQLKIEEQAEAYRQAGATEVEVAEFTRLKIEEIEKKKSKLLLQELKNREDEFKNLQDAETSAIIVKYNNEIAAARGNKAEIERIEEEKKQALLLKTRETIEGQLQILQAELQRATADAEGGLAETILSEEDRAALQSRINDLVVKLSEVGVSISQINQDPETGEPKTFGDILGLDAESIQFTLDIAGQVVGQLGQVFANLSRARITDIENERDELLAAAGDDADKRAEIEAKFENKIAAERKKGLEQKKKFDIAEATVTMLKSIITAFNTGMQAGFPLGPILASTLSGLAIATGSTQIAAIKKQKFADGGVVDVGGRLHSEGGTTYVGEDGNMFEVERGEKMFVLNRGASDFVSRLSNINQAFGGVPLTTKTKYAQDGGVIDGGFSSRQIGAEVAGKIEIAEIVANSVSQVRPQVAVTEINAVNSRLKQSVEISEL
jgi:hypothetical protein